MRAAPGWSGVDIDRLRCHRGSRLEAQGRPITTAIVSLIYGIARNREMVPPVLQFRTGQLRTWSTVANVGEVAEITQRSGEVAGLAS